MSKILFTLVTLFTLAQAPARADESSSHVWTQTEMTALQSQVEETADGESATDALVSPAYYLYYCQAQSYATGRWYWWQSFNLYQARYNALNACVAMNGYTCTVWCR